MKTVTENITGACVCSMLTEFNLHHNVQWTIFDIVEFILVSEAWKNTTKEMYYSLLTLKMISFVLFPQASQPSTNFNISKLV